MISPYYKYKLTASYYIYYTCICECITSISDYSRKKDFLLTIEITNEQHPHSFTYYNREKHKPNKEQYARLHNFYYFFSRNTHIRPRISFLFVLLEPTLINWPSSIPSWALIRLCCRSVPLPMPMCLYNTQISFTREPISWSLSPTRSIATTHTHTFYTQHSTAFNSCVVILVHGNSW